MITVTVGAAIGYYAGGAHTGPSTSATAGVQETGTPPGTAAAPPKNPPRVKVARPDSDYSAPGSPRIHIVEAKTPSLGTPSPDAPPRPRTLRRSSDTSDTTDIPTPDTEASQEASQTVSTRRKTSSAPAVSDGGASPDTAATQTGTTGTAEADGNADPPPTRPDSTASAPTPPKRAAPSSSPTDSEASQVGDTVGTNKAGTDRTAGAAQYRIQAGTFADAKNAHDYLTNLQGRGYDASLHAESQGGQTVYHVQVGAYHDRAAAEDAAAGFRHDGVPVTIAPISP